MMKKKPTKDIRCVVIVDNSMHALQDAIIIVSLSASLSVDDSVQCLDELVK